MITVAIFLSSWMSIMLIMFLLLPFYKNYRIDKFRHRMFRLRAELFDEVHKGAISFESDAYIMLREAMNTFIRFGHKVNLIHFVLISVGLKTDDDIHEPFSQRLKRNCTKQQEEIMMSYYERLNICVVKHMIVTPFSLIVLLILCPILLIPVLILILTKQTKKLLNRSKVLLDSLDLEQVSKQSHEDHLTYQGVTSKPSF